MKKFNSLLLLFLLMLALKPTAAQDSFDRHAMLQNLVDNVILPGYDNFVTASADLESSIRQLSENPSLETLETAQAAWRSASDVWEEIAFIGINIELMALHNQVDKRPINEALMLRRIEAADVFDVDFVASLGSNQKGLPAIEYFLFDASLSNEELLQALNTNPDALPVLGALSEGMHLIAEDLYNY